MSLTTSSAIKVFDDRIVSREWRVEYFDGDGGCYVAIFAGRPSTRADRQSSVPGAARRAGMRPAPGVAGKSKFLAVNNKT